MFIVLQQQLAASLLTSVIFKIQFFQQFFSFPLFSHSIPPLFLPTRAFSWLKAATTAFTFKTLLRHYAKRVLTPRSLNVKLGLRRKGHKGRAVWLA